MMSGHGSNPIFFNKKNKIGRPEHPLAPSLPLCPITFHFYFIPLPPQSGRHMCITPNKAFSICFQFDSCQTCVVLNEKRTKHSPF